MPADLESKVAVTVESESGDQLADLFREAERHQFP